MYCRLYCRAMYNLINRHTIIRRAITVVARSNQLRRYTSILPFLQGKVQGLSWDMPHNVHGVTSPERQDPLFDGKGITRKEEKRGTGGNHSHVVDLDMNQYCCTKML